MVLPQLQLFEGFEKFTASVYIFPPPLFFPLPFEFCILAQEPLPKIDNSFMYLYRIKLSSLQLLYFFVSN